MKRYTINLDDELSEALEAWCKRAERTYSYIFRMLLRQALIEEQHKEQEK